MALLKYLKASKDGLPEPKGSLSSTIPSRAITTAGMLELYEPEDASLSFLILSHLLLKINLQGIFNPVVDLRNIFFRQ